MALITDQVKLNPKATGSLPTGVEGSIAYDSTTDSLKQYDSAWTPMWKVSSEYAPIADSVGTTTNYSNTGSDQTWTVPSGVTIIRVFLWGAGGGAGYHGTPVYGGGGGFTYGTIATTPGETLCIMVGNLGKHASTERYGGGGGKTGDAMNYSTSTGAGRSAIFRGSSSNIMGSNIIELATAGGGGGGGEDFPNNNHSGAGGGLIGQAAGGGNTASRAQGGTQYAKGLQEGNANADLSGDRCRGGHNTSVAASGAGGGGYFGGGAGSQDESGAGGSGYIDGMIWGRTIGGNRQVPGGTTHALYPGSNIGYGQTTGGDVDGYHGYVIIQY